MSELGYGSPKKILKTQGNLENGDIIGYLTGAHIDCENKKSILRDFLKIFNGFKKNYLIAFTKEYMAIGELEKGNVSSDDIVVSYRDIRLFNYHSDSEMLEIVTENDSRYTINVSKYELLQTIKNLDENIKIKYV